jgi:hypothetical protein
MAIRESPYFDVNADNFYAAKSGYTSPAGDANMSWLRILLRIRFCSIYLSIVGKSLKYGR